MARDPMDDPAAELRATLKVDIYMGQVHDEAVPRQGQAEALNRDQVATFQQAAREVRDTPQDQRERDLADVINHLEQTADAKAAPERQTFRKQQGALSDQISLEPDPERRGELRLEREAQGHLYAADLADKVGSRVLGAGDFEGALEVHTLAELHREIAGELSGPERPDWGPDGPQGARPNSRAQFALDAREVGREVLGKSAETVMVAEGPSRPDRELGAQQGRGANDRERASSDARELGRDDAGQSTEAAMVADGPEQPWRPQNANNRAVVMGIGAGGAELKETVRNQPDVTRNPDSRERESPASYAPSADEHDTGARETSAINARHTETARREEAEQDARSGRVSSDTRSVVDARLASHAEEVAQIKDALESEGAGLGPTRESEQGMARSAGRYSSLASGRA